MGFRDFVRELFESAGFIVADGFCEGDIKVPSSAVYAVLRIDSKRHGSVCCDLSGNRYGEIHYTAIVQAYSDSCGIDALDKALEKLQAHTLDDSYQGARLEIQSPCYDSKAGRIRRDVKLCAYELYTI